MIKKEKIDPLIGYMFILVAIKCALAGGLFICALSNATHDDGLMVDMAWNLLNRNWLGPYDNLRLVKGITFPVFLALNHLTGIPYTVMLSFLYGLVCVLFIKMINSIIKNKIILGIIFTIIYFIPANASVHTFIRIYRGSITCILVLLLFTCFVKMYLTRREKGFFLWAVCSGIALALFWNLREDSIWMLPFSVMASVVTAVRIALENKAADAKWFRINILYVILPFLILGLFNTGIRGINYHFYGTFIRNELSEGGFPKLMKALYAIEPDEDLVSTSVPRSTIEKVFEVSPSFRTLQAALDLNYYAGWDGTDGVVDGQVKDGWFFWCLRDCIVMSGYDTSDEMSQFCEQAASEIQNALETGQLPRRIGIVMPSVLMSPWKSSYAAEFPHVIENAFWYLSSHEGDNLVPSISTGTSIGISLFETVTHNLAIKSVPYMLEITGWIVSEEDNIPLEMSIYQNETFVGEVIRDGGQDVYDYYAAQGQYLENAKNSRFSAIFYLDSPENIQIVISKDREIVDRIPYTTEYNGTGYSGNGYHWHFDHTSLSHDTDFEKTVLPRVAIFQNIYHLYHTSGKAVTGIALICYLILTICFLYKAIRKKQLVLLDKWLMVSGLLGSVLVLCIGVAYTEVSAYNAINPTYLSGGKTLLLAFNVLSIAFLGQELGRCFLAKEKKKDTEEYG